MRRTATRRSLESVAKRIGDAVSFKLTQDAIDTTMEMSASAHAVLVVLCRFADDDGKNCYPTTETLSAKTRLHVRTVRGAIRDLEDLGLIVVSQRPGLVRRFSINVDLLKSAGDADHDGEHKSTGGHKSDGGHNHAPDPGIKVTGTPAEKCPRRDQLRDQLKEHTCMQADAPYFNLDSPKFGTSPKNGSTEIGSTEIGSTKNGSTENGTQVVPNLGLRVVPKLGHEQISRTDKEQINTCMQADAPSDFNLESEKPAEPKRKALTHKFELDDLPTEWENYCRQVRPDIDAKKAFIEFRFYFTQGQGAEKRRSERGWNQAWQGWVRRQREGVQSPQNGPANSARKIVFGSISESYARVLASKLCKTGDVGPYGAGCMTWDEAERKITNKLLTNEHDFAGIVALLKRKNILEATA